MKNKVQNELEKGLIDKENNSKQQRRFFHGSRLSRAFFFHISSIISAGSKEPYTYDMLFKLEDEFLYKDFENFETFFEENRQAYEKNFFGLMLRYCRGYIILVNIVFIFR